MKNNYEDIVDKYQNLVYKLAIRLYNGKTEYDDLVQAGFLGLIKAIDNYDVNVSDKFIAYASKYIIYEMKKEFRKRSYFNVSDYLYKLANKVQKINSNDLNEIAESCNTSIENVLIIKSYNMYTIEKIEDYNEIPSNDLRLPIGLTLLEEKIYKMRVLYHYSQKEIANSLLISQSSVSKKLKMIGEKLIDK